MISRLLSAAVAAVALLLVVPAAAQPSFPPLSGRVVDQARLLSPQKEAELTAELARLEADTGDQFVVATLNSLEGLEIEDYGYRLGRAWGIGRSETDSGVLLIVAPNERKVRLEVGYGLEPVLTDAFSNEIIQTRILPAFREGGFERGISQGVEAVSAQLRLDPAEAQARAAAAQASEPEAPILPGLVIVLLFVFLFLALIGRAGRRGRRVAGVGRRRGIDPVLVWGAAEVLSSVARSRSGGGFGGGSFGGFSGGGGSFGGGGASGGW